mgnify:CR=1 FL=1
MNVTASGLGEFAYCGKKWALAQQFGKLSRAELEKRLAELNRAGRESSPEFAMFQRMLSAQDRLDFGTASHTGHARAAASGTRAATAGWLMTAAAVAIAALAIYFFLR